jgi:hypothetical protein
MSRFGAMAKQAAAPSSLGRWDWGLPLQNLQVVVFGEVHAKIPGHDVVVTQVAVNHHAANPIHRIGHTPRGIPQMTPGTRATGPKLAHDTRQTLRPITGTKSAPTLGQSQNNYFIGRVGNHRIEVDQLTLTGVAARLYSKRSCVLYKTSTALGVAHQSDANRETIAGLDAPRITFQWPNACWAALFL